MRIMILGANGFTGRRILQHLVHKQEHNLLACSLHKDILPEEGYQFYELDILNFEATDILLAKFKPEIIINASALSVVDYCEQHQEEAYALNVSAVRHIAEYCQTNNCRLIHLSTDFVFDGIKNTPYVETDIPNPVNYYGKTKRWSEEIIEQICENYAIMRVEVVYGKPLERQHGNIVQLIKNGLGNGQKTRVVSDQFRSPTWVEDIALGTDLLLSSKHNGIYHICGGETMSVADIAYRTAAYFNLDSSLIEPVTTTEMNEATPRPLFSPMNTGKAYTDLGYQPSAFEEGLKEW